FRDERVHTPRRTALNADPSLLSLALKYSSWLARPATLAVAAVLALGAGWPTAVPAQVANFHPCNANPALPVCKTGYGKRIAIRRWGALPEPLDPDAVAKASLVTSN